MSRTVSLNKLETRRSPRASRVEKNERAAARSTRSPRFKVEEIRSTTLCTTIRLCVRWVRREGTNLTSLFGGRGIFNFKFRKLFARKDPWKFRYINKYNNVIQQYLNRQSVILISLSCYWFAEHDFATSCTRRFAQTQKMTVPHCRPALPAALALCFVACALAQVGYVITTISSIGGYGVALDSFGNAVLVETANNIVRYWNKTSNNFTTIVGSGSAGYGGDGGAGTSATLSNPMCVAVDSFNNVYIADTMNNAIRLYNRTTGIITTIAGGGITIGTSGYGDGGAGTAAAFFAPFSVAVDPTTNNVVIADTDNSRIRLWDKRSGNVTAYVSNKLNPAGSGGDGGPGTSASVNRPSGVAMDSAGNTYIADTYNNCVSWIYV